MSRGSIDKSEDYRKPVSSQAELSKEVSKILFRERLIIIIGEIDARQAERISAQLLSLDLEDSKKEITILLDSGQGDLQFGYTIHNLIKAIESKVKIIATGTLAQVAVVIYLSVPKKNRLSLPLTKFLIHQPVGDARGQASDLHILAEVILKTREWLNRLIAEETGQSYESVSRDTQRDHWMDALEAHKYGLVGKVIKKIGKVI